MANCYLVRYVFDNVLLYNIGARSQGGRSFPAGSIVRDAVRELRADDACRRVGCHVLDGATEPPVCDAHSAMGDPRTDGQLLPGAVRV